MTHHFEPWEPGVRLADKWTDIFREDPAVHVSIMLSVAAACFQGFLKDHIGGPLPYALADGFFLLAFMWWFATRALSREPLLVTPRGSMQTTLLLITLLPALYLAVPGTPLLIQLAGLRAWSLFPLACIMALSVIRNSAQARAHVAVVLGLCLVTAIYGIIQYRLGPGSPLAGGAFSTERHGSTVFYFVQGQASQFRAFSTFTFPAPFAGMMVFGMILAAGGALNQFRPFKHRIALAMLIPILFIAMTLSGTRAALIELVLGLMVVAFLRGFSVMQVLLAIPLTLALHFAVVLTSGHAVSRFGSIFTQEGALWTYVAQPMVVAWRIMGQHPFGVGLGRTGVGVPFLITSHMPVGYFIFSDGDIGRAAVDMGALGLLVLAFVIFGLLPLTLKAARMLVGHEEEGVGVGAGALVLSGGVIILIGSPLSAAPHGIIWWFFLGVVIKLALLRSRADAEEPTEEAAQDEEPVAGSG